MTYRYHILEWDDSFETANSRKLQHPYWVSIPNKQSGKGFTRIMVQEDGAAIFGIWILIVEACSSQTPPRAGWLTDDGTAAGLPWTIEDLAERWRRRPAEIARALDVLCSSKVNWIQAIEEIAHQSPSSLPVASHQSPSVQEVQSSPVQEGGAGAPAQAPARISTESDRDERKRMVRSRLARLRFASDDTALEEWCGLLALEAQCRDLNECLECLNTLKSAGKRDGIGSRYAKDYEGLAQRWHQHMHRRKSEEQPNQPGA